MKNPYDFQKRKEKYFISLLKYFFAQELSSLLYQLLYETENSSLAFTDYTCFIWIKHSYSNFIHIFARSLHAPHAAKMRRAGF